MGISRNSYLGPYLRIIPKVSTEEVVRTVCDNNACCNYELNNTVGHFCGNCGCRLVVKSKLKEVIFGAYEALQKAIDTLSIMDNDMMAPEGGFNDFLLPNKYGSNPWDRDSEDIFPERITQEKEQFEVLYSKAIVDLRSLLGDESVKVNWGLVEWEW